jgi:microcystin-dependent protein
VSDPFVAEIRMFGFNFAPMGWAFCNGQLLPISQNTALFSLIGTFYGGDGKSTFALPNLQGSAPLQAGQGPGLSERFVGESGGEPVVTLIHAEMPSHSHPLGCATASGTSANPAGGVWAAGKVGRQAVSLYAPAVGALPQPMNPAAVNVAGGDQPHNNMPPYLVVNFCIAMQGIFPPRS